MDKTHCSIHRRIARKLAKHGLFSAEDAVDSIERFGLSMRFGSLKLI